MAKEPSPALPGGGSRKGLLLLALSSADGTEITHLTHFFVTGAFPGDGGVAYLGELRFKLFLYYAGEGFAFFYIGKRLSEQLCR